MTDATALRAWAGLLAGGRTDGYHHVRLDDEGDVICNAFIPLDDHDPERLSRITLRRPVDARLGMVPRSVREPEAVSMSAVLWVCISGTASNRILGRFKPWPSVVLREGDTSRRIVVWALQGLLRYERLVVANRRLAHYFRAPKAPSAPEALLPAPGTFVLGDRATPVPVVVEHWSSERYVAAQVVRGLRDAPNPKAWRDAA